MSHGENPSMSVCCSKNDAVEYPGQVGERTVEKELIDLLQHVRIHIESSAGDTTESDAAS